MNKARVQLLGRSYCTMLEVQCRVKRDDQEWLRYLASEQSLNYSVSIDCYHSLNGTWSELEESCKAARLGLRRTMRSLALGILCLVSRCEILAYHADIPVEVVTVGCPVEMSRILTPIKFELKYMVENWIPIRQCNDSC